MGTATSIGTTTGTDLMGQPVTLKSTLSKDSIDFGLTWNFQQTQHRSCPLPLPFPRTGKKGGEGRLLADAFTDQGVGTKNGYCNTIIQELDKSIFPFIIDCIRALILHDRRIGTCYFH